MCIHYTKKGVRMMSPIPDASRGETAAGFHLESLPAARYSCNVI